MPTRTETICYTSQPSPLGPLFVAATGAGLRQVTLGVSEALAVQTLATAYPTAQRICAQLPLEPYLQPLLAYLEGRAPWPRLAVDVAGTAFQHRVWQALLDLPSGHTCTYQQLAAVIARPTATRAVARAGAANPVAVVIPCHRVVPKSGGVGGYRWSPERKRALLALEQHLQNRSRMDRASVASARTCA